MSTVPRLTDLDGRTQQNRLDFLRTELDLCSTFADLVTTELAAGNRSAAQRVHSMAEHGYEVMVSTLSKLDDRPEKDSLVETLQTLRSRLDDLRGRIGKTAASGV